MQPRVDRTYLVACKNFGDGSLESSVVAGRELLKIGILPWFLGIVSVVVVGCTPMSTCKRLLEHETIENAPRTRQMHDSKLSLAFEENKPSFAVSCCQGPGASSSRIVTFPTVPSSASAQLLDSRQRPSEPF